MTWQALRRAVTRVLCDHRWSTWAREARTLREPYGTTGPHYYQTRQCLLCGWHQEADVEKVVPQARRTCACSPDMVCEWCGPAKGRDRQDG